MSSSWSPILDGTSLTVEDAVRCGCDPYSRITLSDRARQRVIVGAKFFDSLVRTGGDCYGITTGFGDLVAFSPPPDERQAAQHRLIASHAVGVRNSVPIHIARTMFVLRINCLASGATGIRPETLDRIVAIFNAGLTPELPATGSLGASGDLAPLAALAEFVTGHGWGFRGSVRGRTSELLAEVLLAPCNLERKEGLSLINGTSAMVGIAMHAVEEIELALDAFLLGFASLVQLSNTPTGFLGASALALKPHPGALLIGRSLLDLLGVAASSAVDSTSADQTPYSLRCAPFILGPLIDILPHFRDTLTTEANSANDNPLFIEDTATLYHGGHFHGGPIAVSCDQVRIAATHLSGIIDRQLDYFFDRKRGPSLPPFFSYDAARGYCGLAGAQYLVTSLHTENLSLAQPRSVLAIPTNAGNQDYVSLGMHSALATGALSCNLRYVAAVYLLAASQLSALVRNQPSHGATRSILQAIMSDCALPYKDQHGLSATIESLAARLPKLVSDAGWSHVGYRGAS